MPIERKKGESKNDYMGRCIGIEISNGYEPSQAAAICYTKWDEQNMSDFTRIRKKDLNEDLQFESYTDYPEAAKENAKIALRWADKNGWGSCGTPVGKARANQLANSEPISRDTIARMAAFERHRQNSQKELGDGCGRLMWLAWGGDEGIAWAQRKLEQLETNNFKTIYGNTRTSNNTINSSNVWKFKWNDETGDLVVKFQDGSTYTYYGVSENDFESFTTGSGGTCETSGSNRWGSWEIGKSPSVGAAVWDILMNYRYNEGGNV